MNPVGTVSMPPGQMTIYGIPGGGKTALATSMPRVEPDEVLYFAIDPAAVQLRSVPKACRPPPECVLSRPADMKPYEWLDRLSRVQWNSGKTIEKIKTLRGDVGPVKCNKRIIWLDTYTTWAREVLDEVAKSGLYSKSGARYFTSGNAKVVLHDEGTYGTCQNAVMQVYNQFADNNPDSLLVFIGHAKWLPEKGENNLSSNKGGIALPGKALLTDFLAPMDHVIYCNKQDGKYVAAVGDSGVWIAKAGRDYTQTGSLDVINDITNNTYKFWELWLKHVGETNA